MKNTIPGIWSAALVGVIFCGNALADIQPASPFTDHMVLQRDMPVPIWGKATVGKVVQVSFAGQSKSVEVDKAGEWRVTLDPIAGTSDPATLTIQTEDGGDEVKFADVVVGDVWICSGQSNMQMGAGAAPEIKVLFEQAKGIRSFAVKRTVAFTEQDALEGEWAVGAPDSAVACSFAYHLRQSIDVPVGIILTAWGSSSIEAWMPRDMTESLPHFKTIMEEWDADVEGHERIEAALNQEKWSRDDDVYMRRQSSIVYNAMIKPLAPYACRGLVWYQGERNTRFITGMPEEPQYMRVAGILEYDETLLAWMQRYREEWERDDFHFLVVMLPGYGQILDSGPEGDEESPDTHSWAWMRETQMKALELPHTGVANTIDLGDVKNIHPKDKLPIGQRLALLAERDTLGRDLVAQGPVMKQVDPQSEKLVVHFDFADGLKTLDGAPPAGFWLSDDSRKWHRAEAKVDGETVVLGSSEVKNPLYVRYAFAGKPKVNLVNGAGLPAYPFRSDQFEP